MRGFTLLLLVLLLIEDSYNLWWSMGKPVHLNVKHVCRKARKYTTQWRMCTTQPDLVHYIVKGAALGIQECQNQLRNHRWNCTTNRRSLGKILLRDSKETAFVFAITAAAVAYEITRACSQGHLPRRCTCDRRRTYDDTLDMWHWSGCGDNVDYGAAKSEEFMDLHYGETLDIRARILHHNNQVGRQALKSSLQWKCKCHGMSGSCEMKTCIHKLPVTFSNTGRLLMHKFNQAKSVLPSNDGHEFLWTGASNASEVRHRRDSIGPDHSLIFTEPSPNFCQRNRHMGSLGPKGRFCEARAEENEEGSCAKLCCSKNNYRNVTRVVRRNCQCKFKWCCKVVCDQCSISLALSQCITNV